MSNLVRQLIRDEGDIPYAYKDSLGYWTIGVGFLIDKEKGGRLPDEVRNFWLEYEIRTKREEITEKWNKFLSLDPVRQDAVLNMVFNLGVNGFLKFKKTIAFLEAKDYESASKEMLNSAWARQVGDRSKRLSQQIRYGEYV